MPENRRRISLSSLPGDMAGRDYGAVTRAMEEQLKLQDRIVSAERDRQAAIERTRRQQELVFRDAERNQKATQSAAADPSWSTAVTQNAHAMAEAGKAFDEMQSSSEKFVKSTGSSLKSLFRAVFKGEIDSAKDVWNYFCNFLSDSFSNALSKIASKGFEDLLGNLLGLGSGGGGGGLGFLSEVFHSGGVAGSAGQYRMVSPLAFVGAPRLHSGFGSLSTAGGGGFAPDEFPAILQQGEMVIPRGKWSYAAGMPRALQVEVKIDNQSSVPLKLEQGPISKSLDKVVIGIVAKDIEEYGVLGKILQQRRG